MNILALRWPYLGYWSAICLILGLWMAPHIMPEDHSKHITHDHSMTHGTQVANSDEVPSIALMVTPDAKAGYNLALEVDNFTFAPQNVNQPHQPNEGHAHIYVNGEKLARLYGRHYHLATLPVGMNHIEVTLNSNTHDTLTHNDTPIQAMTMVSVAVK